MAGSDVPWELARAKINLTLHLGRAIADPSDPFYGYHPLDSLVVFADIGDRLTVVPASKDSFQITGPFARELDASDDNLVTRAVSAVRAQAPIPPLSIQLEKNLPIASGIGGGSADAAAILRALQNYVDWPAARWHDVALSLGADVPVCLQSTTSHMSGIGQDLHALDGLGDVAALLVNPGVAVSTPQIFRAYDACETCETPRPQAAKGSLLARALDGRNDMQPPAIAAASIIADVLDVLSNQKDCQLARMSGSGATCFGLFADDAVAQHASDIIRAAHPNWWVQPCRLGDSV